MDSRYVVVVLLCFFAMSAAVVFDWDDYESFDLITLFDETEENDVNVGDPWMEGMYDPVPFISLSGIFEAGPSEINLAEEEQRLYKAEKEQRLYKAEKEQRLYKTEPCRFWLKGNCNWGARCKYAHGNDTLPKEVHPLYKTEFCDHFLDNTECPYEVNNRCIFKHDLFGPEEFEEFKKAVKRRLRAQHKPQE